MAVGSMPLMSMRAMVVLIAGWLAITLGARLFSGERPRAEAKAALVLALPFLVMLIDLLRGPLGPAPWRLVERSAALVIFPVGLLVLRPPSGASVRRRTMLVFVACTALFAIAANLSLADTLASSLETGITFDVAYRSAFALHTGVHPPYAAYWCFTAALFGMHMLLSAGSRNPYGMLLVAGAVLLCMGTGLVLGSRMPVAGCAAGVLVLLFGHLPRRKALAASAGVSLVLVAGLAFVPGISQRMSELADTLAYRDGPAQVNSVTVRTPIIHCSFLLLEEHWLAGMGQAAVQPALDACYSGTGHHGLAGSGHGPHDQPVHWWLSFGLAGLAAFLLLFGWSAREAWRHQDHAHLAFLTFILACSLTEDLLTRQWGVVLFAFFNTLFIAAHRSGVHAGRRPQDKGGSPEGTA